MTCLILLKNLSFISLLMTLIYILKLMHFVNLRKQPSEVVNKELGYVKQWLDANRLSLNVEKTNFIIFRSHQRPLPDNINIKIGTQIIKQSQYVKFLGILLDENLSWKYHLSELAKKLARI